ncbi:MAG: hypothetical protein OXQ30_05455 [Boseongicola sp.]|nr:hypothetical protein [Boseongicola sp.]
MEQFQGLSSVIVQALQDANSEGMDYIGQTEIAVRAVRSVRPDLDAPAALSLVKRYRVEQMVHRLAPLR